MGDSTATSFFVSIGVQPDDGLRNPDGQGFAVFGQVICGMDVVRKIQAGSVGTASPSPVMQGQILQRPVRITYARVTQPQCRRR